MSERHSGARVPSTGAPGSHRLQGGPGPWHCRPSPASAAQCPSCPPSYVYSSPCPSPAEGRESLATRIPQVLNQCQMNEGGREASSQAHALHLRGQEGVGSQEQVTGAIHVHQDAERGSARAPGGGWVRGQLGTLSNVSPVPGLPGKQI